MSDRDLHPGVLHLLEMFESEHLPEDLRPVSWPFRALALNLANSLGSGPELMAGLRKLLEAKDCMVRQAVIDRKKEGQQ